MIVLTIKCKGLRNNLYARVIKSDSLDYTSVPPTELVKGKVKYFVKPEAISVKTWNRMSSQDKLAWYWRNMPRKARIDVVCSILCDNFNGVNFEWYEIL